MMNVIGIVLVGLLLGLGLTYAWADDLKGKSSEESPNSILTLEAVLARVEEGHPILKGSRTQKIVATGKLLKALGTFEPSIVNDFELERLVTDSRTKTLGFNDTFIALRHPWGIKGFAGFRAGIGDVEAADLGLDTSNQPLLGIVFPLLRGLITNPEHAELKKSRLADKQADLEIQQTRQDLYLGAATQYWNWVSAWKLVELQEKALAVAKARLVQLTKQARAGLRAQFDVLEANQETQRRTEILVRSQRKLEKEQFKLALFMWEGDNPVITNTMKAPDFPPIDVDSASIRFEKDKIEAVSARPEVQLVSLEAKFNDIDLELAENNFLPELTTEAVPTRKPGDFVLGLGYRFGVKFSLPFLQRTARGDLLQMEGKAQRLKLLQQYRIQQVTLDIENAQSAITRAQERIHASQQALKLAQALKKGERTRFKLGSTSLIFVNLRERNVIRAAQERINALAEYQKALALYQWAIGRWVHGSPST